MDPHQSWALPYVHFSQSSAKEPSTAQLIYASSFPGIVSSLVSKYHHIFEGLKAKVSAGSFLQDPFFEVLDVIPGNDRRFLQVS